MRRILYMSGAPGCGKSTATRLICDALSETTDASDIVVLSLDTLRHIACPRQHDVDGEAVLLSGRNRKLYAQLFQESLTAHILAGSTIIVDNTNTRQRDFKESMDLAHRCGYEVAVCHFNVDEETLIERDKQRSGTDKVGPAAIHTMVERLKNLTYPSYAQVFDFDFPSPEYVVNAIARHFFMPRATMLTEHERYVVIGDVHSQGDRLEMLETDLQPDDCIVFCGDILDRGTDTLKTLSIIEHMRQSHKVVFVEGNHDEHMRRMVNTRANQELAARFQETAVSLEIVKSDPSHKALDTLKSIIDSLVPVAVIYTDPRAYVITHGGIAPYIAWDIATTGYIDASLTANDFIYGACDRTTAYFQAHPSDYAQTTVDACHGTEHIVQIHGHRGRYDEPQISDDHIVIDSHVWTDEGCLSAVFITDDGHHVVKTYR